jgi:hypothetical protein
MSVFALTAAFTDPAQAAGAALILGLLMTASVVAASQHTPLTGEVVVARPAVRVVTSRADGDAYAPRLVVNRR